VKTPRAFAGAFLVILLLGAVSTAWATTVTECQQLIANLKAQSQVVTLTSKNAEKDRAGLIAKLDAASLALDRAKFCDAIQKLNDFTAKVNQLVAAGHINQDSAAGVTGTELLADADSAIDCINDLQKQSTGGTGCF
jgi:hypothetical protein